jgi:hypothetical protein
MVSKRGNATSPNGSASENEKKRETCEPLDHIVRSAHPAAGTRNPHRRIDEQSELLKIQ